MTRRIDLDTLLADASASELSDAFLARHLRDVDRDDARAQVIARLDVPALDQSPAVVLSAALAALDPTPVLDRVLDVIADSAVDDNGRIGCFRAIMTLPPTVLANAVAGDPRRAAGMEFASAYNALVMAHGHPEALGTLHAMAKNVPSTHRAMWASFVEDVRQRTGLPASVAYARLLGDATLAGDDGARGVWLDAIVAEADPTGVALLQKLRAGAPKKLRAPFQVALLKVETARASGGGVGAADKVRVWCSQPDGQGAVAALVAFSNPDGTSTVINLCFRLTRDLRQGFVQPRTQERDLIEMRRQLTEGSIEVVRAPVGEFATIVDQAVASHERMGVRVPAECEAPIRALERLPRAPLPEAPAPVAVSPERVEDILDEDRHAYWFFDDEDQRACLRGAVIGGRGAVLAALGRSPMHRRVEAMARFMIHWMLWKGDAAQAAEWVAIADEVARDFAGSALVRAMADASDGALGALDDDDEGDEGGDDDEDGHDDGGPAVQGGVRVADYGREGILIAFVELFPLVAVMEARTLRFHKHPRIPDGEYLVAESYCTARACGCERVALSIKDAEGHRELLRVGYAFTDAAAERFHTPRTVLYPNRLNPPWADAMVREIDAKMKSDPAWHEGVVRHYGLARSL